MESSSVCNNTSDNKIGRTRWVRLWVRLLTTELDDTKSYYQLIITVTISERRRKPRNERKGKFALIDRQRRSKLFNVALDLNYKIGRWLADWNLPPAQRLTIKLSCPLLILLWNLLNVFAVEKWGKGLLWQRPKGTFMISKVRLIEQGGNRCIDI